MVTLNTVVFPDSLAAIENNPQGNNNSSIAPLVVSDNEIFGTEGADRLTGTAGDDTIFALGGDDTIVGTTGNDSIFGGNGFDTVDYSGFGEAVTILPAGGFDDGGESLLVRVERIVGATRQANTIDGSSTIESSTSLNVDLERNSLVVENIPQIGTINFEVREFVNVVGTFNSDTIIGGNPNNSLSGGAGNDFIDSRSGNDAVFGEAGDDNLFGGNDNDTLDGGIGNDSLDGGSGNDALFGFEGDDNLFGGNDNDILDAGTGNDFLDGSSGNDELLGFDGDDTLLGGNDTDTLNGGTGNDLLTGGSSSDLFVLAAGEGTDTITDFGRDNDRLGLSGGIGFDDLSFAGNDIIFGSETIATLDNFNTSNLTAGDFTFI